MDAIIQFMGSVDEEDSYALDELAEALAQDGLTNQLEKSPTRRGRKDGGLTIAIALAGLALSAVGTLVSVLSYWKSTRPKYNVSISRGEVTIAIENSTPKQVQETIAKLTKSQAQTNTIVQITTK